MNGRTISHSSISKLAQHHWRQIRYNFQFHWRPTPGLSRGNLWKVKPPFSFRFLQRTSAHITPQSYSFFWLFFIFHFSTRNVKDMKERQRYKSRKNSKKSKTIWKERWRKRWKPRNHKQQRRSTGGASIEVHKCHQTSISISQFQSSSTRIINQSPLQSSPTTETVVITLHCYTNTWHHHFSSPNE